MPASKCTGIRMTVIMKSNVNASQLEIPSSKFIIFINNLLSITCSITKKKCDVYKYEYK